MPPAWPRESLGFRIVVDIGVEPVHPVEVRLETSLRARAAWLVDLGWKKALSPTRRDLLVGGSVAASSPRPAAAMVHGCLGRFTRFVFPARPGKKTSGVFVVCSSRSGPSGLTLLPRSAWTSSARDGNGFNENEPPRTRWLGSARRPLFYNVPRVLAVLTVALGRARRHEPPENEHLGLG